MGGRFGRRREQAVSVIGHDSYDVTVLDIYIILFYNQNSNSFGIAGGSREVCYHDITLVLVLHVKRPLEHIYYIIGTNTVFIVPVLSSAQTFQTYFCFFLVKNRTKRVTGGGWYKVVLLLC